jgi:TatD DNase family protein
MFVDAHCHLDTAAFPEGPDAVLARARAAGVGAVVLVGVSGPGALRAALEVARRCPGVVVTGGVHPHDAAAFGDTVEALEPILRDGNCVAVGEIGLDHHYDHSPRETQARVFRDGIALARRLNLPIVVHSRSAPKETLALLESEGAREVGGVIHCFSEDRAFAAAALDLGFYLSFSGIVTFKNAAAVHDVAAWAPGDRILVETDSPYLAPLPFRGRRCEPAHVVHTARRIAELRRVAVEEVERSTTENAIRRYGAALGRAVARAEAKAGLTAAETVDIARVRPK